MGGLHFGSGPLATMPSVTTGFVSFLRPHIVGIASPKKNSIDDAIIRGGGGPGSKSNSGGNPTNFNRVKPKVGR